MNRIRSFLVFAAVFVLFVAVCDFAAADDKLCSVMVANSGGRLVSCERTNIVNDIYEYKVVVKLGSGEYDKIGIHRVVREKAPWVPVKTAKAVMMVHGDASDFDTAFLMSALSDKVAKDQSIGVYLAQNGVDVWGVDLRWTFVKDNTTNFTFMRNWSTETHLKDIKTAVKVMRAVRLLTDGDAGKVFMLGHSRGAQLAYSYADQETQVPTCLRDLKGIIPIDYAYKFSPQDDDQRLAACSRYLGFKKLYDAGVSQSDEAYRLRGIAQLAAAAPDAPSPLIPGLSNLQTAWFIITATYATYAAPYSPPTPFYHYLAGTYNETGMPTGLTFSNMSYIIDFALDVPGFQSLGEILDGEAIACNDPAVAKVKYSDHLSQIKVPVYYVGAAGGFGAYGKYTTTLLGSTDVSTNIVKLLPDEAVALDYGHIDLLYAGNAKDLVWQPIKNWIKSR